MRLTQLFPYDDLLHEINSGYVRATHHPSLNLTILNYTRKAQYETRWNPVTRNCRGLIVQNDGDVIVARPWPKFFNLQEHIDKPGLPDLDLDAPCETVDKLDGSLGILYHAPDGPRIATKGSFESEQAQWATRWLRENAADWQAHDHCTYLFEIVYPDNRIVVKYDFEGLVLLDALDTETGQRRSDPTWPGRRAETLPYRTLRQAIEAPPRPNAEGLVCRTDTGLMVKIKQDDYLAAHRVVTGLSKRTVWEAITGNTFSQLVEGSPEEFHGWLNDVHADLVRAAQRIVNQAEADHARVTAESTDRAGYAALAKMCARPALMFAILDGKDVWAMALKEVKPSGEPIWKDRP